MKATLIFIAFLAMACTAEEDDNTSLLKPVTPIVYDDDIKYPVCEYLDEDACMANESCKNIRGMPEGATDYEEAVYLGCSSQEVCDNGSMWTWNPADDPVICYRIGWLCAPTGWDGCFECSVNDPCPSIR